MTHPITAKERTTLSTHVMDDVDLIRYLHAYQRDTFMLPAGDPTQTYLAYLCAVLQAELDYRRLAHQHGAPHTPTPTDEATKREIRRRLPLDTFFEQYLGATLHRQSGSSRRGPCPLCHSSPASTCLAVYMPGPEDHHYVCFKCGARGDIFTAIQQAFDLPTFAQVMTLARTLAGVSIAPQKPLQRVTGASTRPPLARRNS